MQRKNNQRREKESLKRKLHHYEEDEISLDDEQSNEMSFIVSTIERNYSDEIDHLCSEGKNLFTKDDDYTFVCIGDKYGVGHQIRNVWNTDKQRESNAFKKDQLMNSKLSLIIIINYV